MSLIDSMEDLVLGGVVATTVVIESIGAAVEDLFE